VGLDGSVQYSNPGEPQCPYCPSLYGGNRYLTRPKELVPRNGPPQELISRINHLGNLLKFLPDSLPLDPPDSKYYFGLDTDDVEQEGVRYAFNCNLEALRDTRFRLVAGSGVMSGTKILRYKTIKNLTTVINGSFKHHGSYIQLAFLQNFCIVFRKINCNG
jgi:hypothetical protein